MRSIHNIIGPTYLELLEGKIQENPFINMNEFEAFLKNELRLNEAITNQIISITSTTSKNFLLNAKVVYRDSYITFTTSIIWFPIESFISIILRIWDIQIRNIKINKFIKKCLKYLEIR